MKTSARPDFSDALWQQISSCQTVPVDIDILQPADPFLDMAGEDLRRRIFMTENENGDSLCLRPEFTIPVCLAHIASHSDTPQRYGYLGEVFRQRRDGGNGFYQAGIEDFGASDEAAADARSLKDACQALETIAPDGDFHILLGDQTVFEGVLSALGLPLGWQKKLLRAFGNDMQMRIYLEDLSAPKNDQMLSGSLAALVDAGDEAALVAALEEEMRMAGISPSSGRSPLEIAKRLLEKKALSSVGLSKRVFEAMRTFLTINCSLDKAEAVLREFAFENNLELDGILTGFAKRNQAFEKAGLDLCDIIYDAAFGRPLDYYTGLVYEIRDGHQILVGGGRYNRLLTMLGAKREIPAVGFSIWLDRLEESHWLDRKDNAS